MYDAMLCIINFSNILEWGEKLYISAGGFVLWEAFWASEWGQS